MNFKQLAAKPQKLASGHRSCAGCGFPIIVRAVLASTDDPIVVANATGCLEVTTTIYPYSSWKIPFIHSAFENAGATISGVETAYKALKKKGKINQEIKFVAFGGDGGTYDIGLQSLSGTLERGHNILYVLYDNEAYMNTGIQRSSATPFGASTTTDPAGKLRPGKQEFKKNIAKVVAAHNIPYVAQASVHNLIDLTKKAEKAFSINGPKFMVVLQPCTLGWRYPSAKTIEIAKLAVESCFWPLYEIENGEYKLTYKPRDKIPVTDFLKPQGRFKHLFSPGNGQMLQKIQEHVDLEWGRLLKLCGEA
ncbi:pyruvate ferredoxin oxidoreductase [Candidatus Woesearchaeota archaeon]|nr:pyruvate ferredoxin oxidoreductase [Candidatus Woesearchaeota archaeon]